MGWSYDPEGKTPDPLLKAGDKLKDAEVHPTEDITVYAVWRNLKTTYSAWSQYNDASTYEFAEPEKLDTIDIPIPKHKYMKFNGYYTEPDDGDDIVDGIEIIDANGKIVNKTIAKYVLDGKWGNEEGIHLYAHWDVDTEYVTFDANDGYINTEKFTEEDFNNAVSGNAVNLLNKSFESIKNNLFKGVEPVLDNAKTTGTQKWYYYITDSKELKLYFMIEDGFCKKVEYKSNTYQ